MESTRNRKRVKEKIIVSNFIKTLNKKHLPVILLCYDLSIKRVTGDMYFHQKSSSIKSLIIYLLSNPISKY